MSVNIKKVIDESKLNNFHLMLFACCLIIITMDGFDLVVYGASVPLIMKEWGLNATQTGVIGSYALIGAAIGALLFGSIADRVGRKKTLISMIVLFSIFSGLTGFSTSPSSFSVCRFISGLGLGGVLPNVVSLVTEFMPKRNRSVMLTMSFCGIQIGGIFASALGIWLFPIAGWRSVYWFGAILLILLPVFITKIPDAPAKCFSDKKISQLEALLRKLNPQIDLNSSTKYEVDVQIKSDVPVIALFKENRAITTVIFWVVYFMNMLMIFGLGTWLPKLMMNAGYGLGSSLMFLLTLNVGAIIGSIIGGKVADSYSVKKVVILLYFLSFIFIPLLGLKVDPIILGIFVALAGACTLGTMNVAHAYVSQYYPTEIRSTGMGWAFGIGRIGAVAGPTLGGILVSRQIPLTVNFMVFAVAGLIACVGMVFAQDKYSFTKSTGKQVMYAKGEAINKS